MKNTNTTVNRSGFMAKIVAMAAMFSTLSASQKNSAKKTNPEARYALGGGFENPIYIPRKHTKMSYRTQQKNAKKRRYANS